MFLIGCWCIAILFACVDSQNSEDLTRFSNYWNSNNNNYNNRPFIGNTNSNFFGSSIGNDKNYKWGYETVTNTEKTTDWNPKKPSKANNDRQSNAFENRPNKKKSNSIMNSPNSSKWNTNSNNFNSNSDFSSWGYNNAKPSSNQNNKRPEEYSNGLSKNKTNGNDIFSESNNEDNSVYPSWGTNNNKKPKPTPSSYGSFGGRETTTPKNSKNAGKWETNNNNKPQKGWESPQPGRESSNSNPSTVDTSILDELDKNDWYFGKESNYPKPPFKSTLNIDVSELWNFDKNRKTNQNSNRKNENGAKINKNNNYRRNRQIERLSERMGDIHCECVNVNLCEKEDMIITQEDIKFEMSPLEDFICERLTDVCCTNPKIKEEAVGEDYGEEKERLLCGQSRVGGSQFESFGGNIAEPGEFPWILRLEYAELNCSASLIHHQMALTAAHCVTSAQTDELTLKAGIWNLNNEPPQYKKVTKIILHPDYDSRNPRNDIALLVLETPFELTDNVNTICLPKTNDKWESDRCVIAGWKSEDVRGQHSEVLKKEVVNFLPQSECQNIMLITDLWRHYILHDSFICGLGETTKSCIGDEGGFVICPSKKQPNTYLQIGIISKGIKCDNYGRPGIFTNVLKFLDWINQNTFELGLYDDIDIRSLK